MMGVRDINVFPLYGTRKNAGDIGAPFFPTNGVATYVAAVGADGGDYTTAIAGTKNFGVTGTAGGSVSTTLSSAASATGALINVTQGLNTTSVSSGTLSTTPIAVMNIPGQTTLPTVTVGAGGITNVATSLPLTFSVTFTGTPIIQIDGELLTVTGGSGTTTLTVTRGTGGTTAATHAAGAVVFSTVSSTSSTLVVRPTATGQVIAGTVALSLTATAAASTIIQVDTNSSTTAAEVRTVQTVTGAGPYIVTLDAPLYFDHASGAAVISVVAPFTHTVLQSNNLPSLTLEKNIGGFQSLQFAGAKIAKYTLKAEAGETPVSFTASVIAKNYAIYGNSAQTTGSLAVTAIAASTPSTGYVTYTAANSSNLNVGEVVTVTGATTFGYNITGPVVSYTATTFTLANSATGSTSTATASSPAPSAISVVNELPFVFAEANVQLNFGYGGLVATSQVQNVSIDIENGLKPTYTFNNSHDLQFLTPVTRKVSGQLDVVFTSLTDAQWGFFSIMQEQIQGSIQLTFTHPTGVPNQAGTGSTTFSDVANSFTISLPACSFAKYSDSLKLEDVVMSTLNFEAAYNIGGSGSGSYGPNQSTIQSQIVDGRYIPF